MDINDKELGQIINDAKGGDTEAQYKLGLMYLNNQGVSDEDRELLRAVESGESNALVPNYYWWTASYLGSAAKKGHAGAQYEYGRMFFEGNRVGQNKEHGIKLFREAAEQGHTEAIEKLHELGVDYKSKTVAEEHAEYVQELIEKVEQGDAEAQHDLATLYAHGSYGLKTDKVMAYELFKKSAEQGYEPAYCWLDNVSWTYS